MIRTRDLHRVGVVIILVMVLFAGCGARDAGKIPITTKSEQAKAYYLQGRDLADKLQNQEALQFFALALKEDSEFALAYLGLAQAQPGKQGLFQNLNRAEELSSQQVEEASPAVAEAGMSVSISFPVVDSHSRNLKRASRLIEKVSPSERTLILALLASYQKDAETERVLFSKLADEHPNDERVHQHLGNYYYFKPQDYRMALSEYARAIEIDPDFSPAYNMIGYTQVQLGNHEAAAVAFREYIRLIPDDPNPYDSYAEMLMKMGRFDESMDMYREAISKDSSFSASYLGVAGNLNLLDRHPEAREFLQNLFDAPNTRDHRTQAFYAIAVSFVDEGKLESALTVLEHCCDSLRTRQDIVSLANNLHDQGFILIEMQQFEKALRKFEEALNLIENTDLADEVVEGYQRANLLRAANVALKQKKFDLAREKLKEWETLAEAMNLPRWREHSHLGKGMIAMEDGDFDRAVTEIRQSNLSRVHNLFQLALAYDGQGATSLARDYYLRAARYHAPCSLEYAMVRKKALARADELSLQ